MTKLVGILNLTPDSFSCDGVLNGDVSKRIEALVQEGAHIIDVGAESTRPGAEAITQEDEWRRLESGLEWLTDYRHRSKGDLKISVDTYHALTAERAIALGVDWINDVSGGHNPDFIHAVAQSKVQYVLMHSLSVPADKQRVFSDEADPVEAVLKWAELSLARLESLGLARTRVIFDPGIGFGKTPAQSLALIKDIARFRVLGMPIMVGHSRKSFLAQFSPRPASQRDIETVLVSAYLVGQGVDYLRVHNVAAHNEMLRIQQALGPL